MGLKCSVWCHVRERRGDQEIDTWRWGGLGGWPCADRGRGGSSGLKAQDPWPPQEAGERPGTQPPSDPPEGARAADTLTWDLHPPGEIHGQPVYFPLLGLPWETKAEGERAWRGSSGRQGPTASTGLGTGTRHCWVCPRGTQAGEPSHSLADTGWDRVHVYDNLCWCLSGAFWRTGLCTPARTFFWVS